MNKQLFLAVLFARDSNNTVVEIQQPEWVVETTEDRAKASVLADKLNDDTGLDWNVKILKRHQFSNFL